MEIIPLNRHNIIDLKNIILSASQVRCTDMDIYDNSRNCLNYSNIWIDSEW